MSAEYTLAYLWYLGLHLVTFSFDRSFRAARVRGVTTYPQPFDLFAFARQHEGSYIFILHRLVDGFRLPVNVLPR